jgi:hypothetical protein
VRWQTDWLDQIPDEHWICEMLLTDPPITKALIQKESYDPDDGLERGSDFLLEDLDSISSSGLDITHLRDFFPPKNHGKPDIYRVGGSNEWLPVPNGYKTRGWEMLCLLETEGEQRREMLCEMESAAFPGKYPSWMYR